jgi:hypothetical protein
MEQTLQPVFRSKPLFGPKVKNDKLPGLGPKQDRGVFGALLTLLAIVAGAAAVGLTVYTLVLAFRPDLIQSPYRLDDGLADNLKVGVIFFWLELAGIVLGLRLYDQAVVAVRQTRQLFDIHATLIRAINEIVDARWDLAVALDASIARDGRYDKKLIGALNRTVHSIRHRVLKDLFSSTEFTSYARGVLARFLQILDRLVEETYQLARDADRQWPHASNDQVSAMLDEFFVCTDPDSCGLDDLDRILLEVREVRAARRSRSSTPA